MGLFWKKRDDHELLNAQVGAIKTQVARVDVPSRMQLSVKSTHERFNAAGWEFVTQSQGASKYQVLLTFRKVASVSD